MGLPVESKTKNHRVVMSPLVERNACGIILTAKRGEPAFSKIKKKDLCRVARQIKKATGVQIQGARVYLIGFFPWHWNNIPTLTNAYTRENLDEWGLYEAGFAGYYFGEGIIQIDPSVFTLVGQDTTWSRLELLQIGRLEMWNGMGVIAHELLHDALDHAGVPSAEHHCVMSYRPHEYWNNVSRTLGVVYRVSRRNVELQNDFVQAVRYKEQCSAWLLGRARK